MLLLLYHDLSDSAKRTGFMGRWADGIATRSPGGHEAHADRLGQLAAREANISLTQVVHPSDYPREALFGGSSRKADFGICLLETQRALPVLPRPLQRLDTGVEWSRAMGWCRGSRRTGTARATGECGKCF